MGNTNNTLIRVPWDVHAELKGRSEREGRSMAEVLRRVLGLRGDVVEPSRASAEPRVPEQAEILKPLLADGRLSLGMPKAVVSPRGDGSVSRGGGAPWERDEFDQTRESEEE